MAASGAPSPTGDFRSWRAVIRAACAPTAANDRCGCPLRSVSGSAESTPPPHPSSESAWYADRRAADARESATTTPRAPTARPDRPDRTAAMTEPASPASQSLRVRIATPPRPPARRLPPSRATTRRRGRVRPSPAPAQAASDPASASHASRAAATPRVIGKNATALAPDEHRVASGRCRHPPQRHDRLRAVMRETTGCNQTNADAAVPQRSRTRAIAEIVPQVLLCSPAAGARTSRFAGRLSGGDRI